MQYTSSVNRLPNDQFITIRASYVKMCNGNTVAAALISFFENWHNFKLKQIAEWEKVQGRKDRPNTWQHHTGRELAEGILGIGKRHSIDQAKQQLVSMGVIVIGRNPDYKFAFDATLHYQFQPDVVSNLLAFVENSKTGQFVKIDISEDAENDKSGEAENSAAIPNNSTSKPQETIPAANAPATKKRKRTGDPPDKDWQRWVDIWFQFYETRHGVLPMFNPAQAQALKKLRVYLVAVSSPVEGASPDDCGFQSWGYILQYWDRLDDWQRGQFDLTVILKKINDILNRLRNGTKTNRGPNSSGTRPGTSEQRVDAVRNY